MEAEDLDVAHILTSDFTADQHGGLVGMAGASPLMDGGMVSAPTAGLLLALLSFLNRFQQVLDLSRCARRFAFSSSPTWGRMARIRKLMALAITMHRVRSRLPRCLHMNTALSTVGCRIRRTA
jgi:hypothetical protein